MLKLGVSYTRKTGEPNYGSRGAGISLELELDTHLAARPKALRRRVRRLFRQARTMVNQELNHRGSDSNGQNMARAAAASETPSAGHHRPATPAQLRAISRLAARAKRDPAAVIEEHFGPKPPETLSLAEASRLIDFLQAEPPVACS